MQRREASVEETGQKGNTGHCTFLPEHLCIAAHLGTQLYEVPQAPARRVARTWVGVRDEHPGCNITRRVGAELV